MKALEKQTKNSESEKRMLTTLNDDHKKAQMFYTLKRNTTARAKLNMAFEATTMGHQKNVSLPNITTNDVYYKRQLSISIPFQHSQLINRQICFSYISKNYSKNLKPKTICYRTF